MVGNDALYYPFSRCIDSNVLKQFLLLFDSVTFLDCVDDDQWRGKLFEDVEYEHHGYSAYRDLAQAMPWLRREGVIKVCAPESLKSLHTHLTIGATLSDLADDHWVADADPRRFQMPTQYFEGIPSWNIFKPKIPDGLVDALGDVGLTKHLLYKGTEHSAWNLSYAAGSSVGINVHLAAASELSLSPVTDSRLHHELMLRKLGRAAKADPSPARVTSFSEVISRRTVFNVIENMLPASRLEMLSMEDILRFREDTGTLRRDFIADVGRIVAAEADPSKAIESDLVVNRVTNALLESARVYGAEIAAVRDKLWPKLIEGIIAPAPLATSAATLAASYITGSGYVIAASVVVNALGPLRSAMDWRADMRKADRSARSSVAYLSKLQQL